MERTYREDNDIVEQHSVPSEGDKHGFRAQFESSGIGRAYRSDSFERRGRVGVVIILFAMQADGFGRESMFLDSRQAYFARPEKRTVFATADDKQVQWHLFTKSCGHGELPQKLRLEGTSKALEFFSDCG